MKTKLLILITVMLGTFACQKQVDTKEKIDVAKYYFRITEYDLDGIGKTSTPIFSGMVSSTTLNDGGDDSDEGWEAWGISKRKQWCDNHNPKHRHYCLICSTSPLCAPTPCQFTDWGIENNSVTWTTATEANIDRFDIEFSKDGLNFKTYGKMKPRGASKYVFEIK